MTATEPATMPELLRAVADLLEAHPDLPVPQASDDGVRWFTARTPTEIAKVMRAVQGPWAKNDPNASDYDRGSATFTTTLLGHPFTIYVDRGSVCTRTVVGTREVVKTIPVATEEVTVTEDIIEWECHSVLTQAGA